MRSGHAGAAIARLHRPTGRARHVTGRGRSRGQNPGGRADSSAGWLARRGAMVRRSLELTDDQFAGLVLALAASPLGVAAASLVLGPVGALGAVAGVVGAAMTLSVALRNRRRATMLAALPTAIEIIARSLRSGSTLHGAVVEASMTAPEPLANELARVVDDVERGRPLAAAVESLARRRPMSQVRVVASAVAMAAENEAGSARALEGVARSLRDRSDLDAELRTLTAQAGSSLVVLVAMPLVFIAFGAMVGTGAARFLFGDPFGRLCLLCGLALDGAGWLWMRRLVVAAVP